MDDIKFMKRALALAEKGVGRVNPNPLVGAIIVKNGRVVGQGYHERYGGHHAEVNALASCTTTEGATMYVTLEPCSHHGKTPPCVDAILESGISRLVVGSLDENPLVSSMDRIRASGIEVVTGVLKKECDELNDVFFHYIKKKMPYVLMKYAMTCDGKTATHTGASRWITGRAARNHVHEDRNRYMGIMVGVGTVIADDPMLNCRRRAGGRNPMRMICDTTLRTPLDSRVITTATEIPTILITACQDESQHQPYLNAGCQVLRVPLKGDQIDLHVAMKRLAEEGIDGILLEGGATLNAAALEAGLVRKVQAYIAPKLFGGTTAPSPIAGTGVANPKQAYLIDKRRFTMLGEDILIEGEVVACSRES